MSVLSGTVAVVERKPFTSVGLTCPCGRSCVGFEGLLSCECGAIYTVSVLVIQASPSSVWNSHDGQAT